MRRSPLPQTKRRKFGPSVYRDIIARQQGVCACGCMEALGTDPRGIEFDHELDLAFGGPDTPDNLRALKKRHHLDKTKANAPKIAKLRRIVAGGSHRRRNLSVGEKQLAKMLERNQ